MKNKLDEEYIFYSYAIGDLQEAYNVLKTIKRCRSKIIISALIIAAIIAYLRPFKKCHGKFGRYNIKDDIIPAQSVKLHQKIITYRDRIFAHSDISIRKPSLHKKQIENKNYFSISWRGFVPADFLHDINSMKQLIDAIVISLRSRKDQIRKKIDEV